ncbi:MAG: DUF4157 domain-containing protein [Pyrinomonadaceae bacterium]
MHDLVSKKLLHDAMLGVGRARDSFADSNSASQGVVSRAVPILLRQAICSCGGGCPACQTKSSVNISQPNDPAEIEADRMADRVMRMSVDDVKPKSNLANASNAIHRKCDACEDEEEQVPDTVQRKEAFSSAAPQPPPGDTPPSIRNVINSGGRPLDLETRKFFEPRFGHDLSSVRIHTDSTAGQSARSIDARAYTLGSNIVFGSGEYKPESESGKQLIAHELAHTVQQQEDTGLHRKAVIHRKAGTPADSENCKKFTKHEFDGTINDSRPTGPHFLPRKYHSLEETSPGSGSLTRKPYGDELAVGKELEIRKIDSSGSKGTFLGVCDKIEGVLPTTQILYIPAQYVTRKDLAPAAAPGVADPQSMPGTPDRLREEIESIRLQLGLGGDRDSSNSCSADEFTPVSSDQDILYQRLLVLEAEQGQNMCLPASERPVVAEPGDELSEGQSIPGPADDIIAGIGATPPESMSGTELENEINDLLFALDLPALDLQNPIAVTQDFAPTDNEWDLFYRLNELEIEYFERRGLSDQVRKTTNILATQQRESGLTVDKAIKIGMGLTNPATAPMALLDAGAAALGNPVEDFATGFLPGFLAGAVIELPRDVFEKLDAETKEHWIAFNGGIMVGIPVGALEGVWELFVGLYELGKLAVEFSPIGMAWSSGKDVYRMITDYEKYDEEETKKIKERQAIAGAVIDLIIDMFKDPAFMLEHGRELGEIAGRSASRWFNEDFMKRSTFDKGYTIGKVEGRVVFEILALFLGPEEWIARGAAAAGQFAKLSGPLRKAIITMIEKVPALKKMMDASKLAKGERLLGEAAELASGAGKLADEVGGGTRITDEAAELAAGTRKLATETGDVSKILDPEDLADLGPINRDTVISFQKHPDMLRAWAEHPEAAQALKFCESPCWPENITDVEQVKRLDEFVRRAKAQGVKFDRRKLNTALKNSDETQINNLLDGLEGRLDPTPPETGFGTAPDADLSVVDRPPPGSHSEAGLSGQVGEATEAANAGAKRLPQTYAQRFSPQTREELRQIFSDFGDDALTEFVNRLDLPQGGLAQVEIPTSEGLRKVDRLFRDGANIVMREVKNYTKSVLDRTARIADEIAKDIAILGRFPDARVEWVVNGTIRQGLLDELVLLEAEWPGRFRLIHGEPFNIIP